MCHIDRVLVNKLGVAVRQRIRRNLAKQPLAFFGGVAGGYEFGRRLYESTRARSSGVPEADLDPAWTVGAKLSLRL